ncbi:MAG: pantetheine-phosphate adenylyltransferase [Verrucomicrobia bacterium]|nr:pantetheine-phosphate adenylyltransferase [Verrucomicrobiota bacterium]
MKGTAIYAGTFDPVTLGHFDLIQRSAGLFEQLILAVVVTPNKRSTLFSAEERVDMTRKVVAGMPNVEVDTFESLLIDYARKRGVCVLIRGVRAYSDFEYEFRMALMNRKLAPEIETLFMMPSETQSYVSSSLVKEVAARGGDVSMIVPALVQQALTEKYRSQGP